MKKILLSGLAGGVLAPLVGIMVFASVIIPQLSVSEPSTASCLPPARGATLSAPRVVGTSIPHAVGAGPEGNTSTVASACIGNKAVVQAALAIVAHLHGDPDVYWDKGMPAQVVNYWASTCPPGSGCWIDWQNSNLQCVMLVKGAYALAGAPLPLVSDAIGFWSLYANRSGWSEILSFTTPRHLPLPGDIMVWSHATLGHVAIVTAVVPPANGHSGSITFAQANHTGSFIKGQFVPGIVTEILAPDLSVLTWPGYQLMGYIRPNSVYIDLAAQDAIVAGIPPALFQQQIKVESNFDPDALSPTGAIGIAQFLPTTASHLNPPLDPTDPVASLAVAAQYMATKERTFKGDYTKALAAYDAGDQAVSTAAATYGVNWLQHMPQETISYVESIMAGS